MIKQYLLNAENEFVKNRIIGHQADEEYGAHVSATPCIVHIYTDGKETILSSNDTRDNRYRIGFNHVLQSLWCKTLEVDIFVSKPKKHVFFFLIRLLSPTYTPRITSLSISILLFFFFLNFQFESLPRIGERRDSGNLDNFVKRP